MATKKKQKEPKDLLITAIKKTVNVNTVLPILENVYFNGKQAIVTDLENTVIIPFEMNGLNVCLPSKKVIEILEMMPDATAAQLPPTIAKVEQFKCGQIYYCGNRKDYQDLLDSYNKGNDKSLTLEEYLSEFGVPADGKTREIQNYGATFTQGKRTAKITGDNPENFPIIRMNDEKEYKKIGALNESDMKLIETALCYVSNDDLRPAMTGIKLEKRVLATDAHRLFFHDLSEPVTNPFIMPAKAAKILLALGGTWTITEEVTKEWVYVCLTREDGIKLITRPIDARYPDVDCVIPKDKELVKLVANPDTFLAELKNAGKFSNKSTNQVVLGMNGAFTISSQEVDFGEEYINEFPNSNTGDFSFGFSKDYPKQYTLNGNPAVIKEDMGGVVKVLCDGNITTVQRTELIEQHPSLYIAFNQKFLSETISKLKDEPVKMKFWSATKCTVINDHFLIMPLMLYGD